MPTPCACQRPGRCGGLSGLGTPQQPGLYTLATYAWFPGHPRQHPVQGSVSSLGSPGLSSGGHLSEKSLQCIGSPRCCEWEQRRSLSFLWACGGAPGTGVGAGFRAGSALPGSRPWWPPLLPSRAGTHGATCPRSPALNLHPLGGSRELLAGSWPRGLLELPGASLPTPDRPLGRREGCGGSGAGRGLRSPKPSTHAGRRPLHGADLHLELTGEQLLVCQFVAKCVRLLTTLLAPCVNRLFPDPPSTPHTQ